MTYSQEATQGPTSIASSDVQDAVVTVVVVLSEVILTQKGDYRALRHNTTFSSIDSPFHGVLQCVFGIRQRHL